MIADWPGLKTADLYENRDLKPTTDLRAVLKGLLKDHLRLNDQALAGKVFPGSADVPAMVGLCHNWNSRGDLRLACVDKFDCARLLQAAKLCYTS